MPCWRAWPPGMPPRAAAPGPEGSGLPGAAARRRAARPPPGAPCAQRALGLRAASRRMQAVVPLGRPLRPPLTCRLRPWPIWPNLRVVGFSDVRHDEIFRRAARFRGRVRPGAGNRRLINLCIRKRGFGSRAQKVSGPLPSCLRPKRKKCFRRSDTLDARNPENPTACRSGHIAADAPILNRFIGSLGELDNYRSGRWRLEGGGRDRVSTTVGRSNAFLDQDAAAVVSYSAPSLAGWMQPVRYSPYPRNLDEGRERFGAEKGGSFAGEGEVHIHVRCPIPARDHIKISLLPRCRPGKQDVAGRRGDVGIVA